MDLSGRTLTIFIVLISLTSYVRSVDVRIRPIGELFVRPTGNTVFFTCTVVEDDGETPVDSSKHVRLQWLDKSGTTISQKNGRRYIDPDESGHIVKLYITNIELVDEGHFSCVALVDGVRYVKNVSLVIFKDIAFSDAPQHQSLHLGSSSVVRCLATGQPAPTVSWRFAGSGNRIYSDGRYSIRPDGLHIANVTYADDGKYICRAEVETDGRYDNRQIEVSVHVAPKLLRSLGNIEGTEGSELVLSCNATGLPHPAFTFHKNGDQLVSGNHINVDTAAGTVHFNPLYKADEGRYNCSASNDVGTDSSAGQLTVRVKATVKSFPSMTGTEFDSATLTCETTGDPTPAVTIRRADRSSAYNFGVNEEDRIVLQQVSRGTIELTIKSLTPDDSALYVCSARNAVGVNEQSATLTVNYKPRFAASHSQTVYTWAGVTRNVTCHSLAGPPATVEWKRFGLKIAPNNSYQIFATKNTSYLQVHVREVDQAWIYGIYTCTARNDLGEESINIDLRRASVPDTPATVRLSSAMPDAVELEIGIPEEDGGMPIIGFHVQYEDQVQNFLTKGNKILLKNLRPSTTYLLRVSAMNEVGFGSHVEVRVQTTSLNVPRGLSITSPSTANSPSQYTIQWDVASTGGMPIVEYHFKYRLILYTTASNRPIEDSDWTSHYVSNDPSFNPVQHTDINNLVPDSQYQLRVQARNEIGWSEFSPVFNFETPPAPAGGHLTAPSSCQHSPHSAVMLTLSTALSTLFVVQLLSLFHCVVV